jgi:hypothetical protein
MRLGQGKAIASLAAALAVAGCAGMHGAGSGGWTTLIDGERGLENFDRVGDADWHAADGAIVADRKESKPSAFLVTRDSYRDFEVRAEFWVSHDANSGIYMRCADGTKPTDTTCYEANIYDERPEAKYGTGAITHLAAVDPMPKAGGKWNTYDITVKGPRVTVVLNGEKTAEIEDPKLAAGPIALQYVQGVVKFRKVQIRPL